MQDENNLRKIIRKEIEAVAKKAQYGVSRVPFHTHNGIDSPQIVSGGGSSTVYAGEFDSGGNAVLLPTGWTSAKTGTGQYTVTHNLGTTDYEVVAMDVGFTLAFVTRSAKASNSFGLATYSSASSSSDRSVGFILVLT